VEDLSDTVIALNDSGCQLCAVNAETVRSLDLPVFGQVKLRGISDRHLVPADVVKIRARLTTRKGFINVTCAVVEKLNYPLILGSDIVDKLNKQLIDESFLATEMMNVVHEKDDDLDDDDDFVDEKVTNDKCDEYESENVNMSDPRKASAEILSRDQRSDRSLIHCWSLGDRHKAGYYVRDGVLYRNYKYLCQECEQLVLPVNRRPEVMKLTHEVYAGHLGAKKTKERIKLSFTWPTIASDVQKACESYHQCQKKRRVTVYDRVPITPIPRGDIPFDSIVMDCLGPLFSNQKVEYNYALVLCDSNTRYPFDVPLRSLTAKSVCNALLQVFQLVGIPSTIRSDCGSNFTSSLTTTFLKIIGCSPNFNVPGRPQQTGLCERLIGTVKNMINKVASGNPKSYHKHVGFVL